MFDRKKMIKRYKIVAYAMVLVGIAILVRVVYIATVERSYWMDVAELLTKDSVDVKPVRGNILSSDGRLMAGSLSEYRLFVDFKAGGDDNEVRDSLWDNKIDSLCMGLHEIFPEFTVAQFKENLEKGRAKGSRHWPVVKRRVNYSVYSEVKKLPIFNTSANAGGFHVEKFNARKRPFGSLAKRTIGDLFGGKDTARFGLELSYDSILRGKNGRIRRQKVRNEYIGITIQDPVNGADIVTTIDVDMQDLAERSLIDELKQVNGNVGVAMVMEVKTGDIKAIVNMTKCADGEYYEIKNSAVSDLLEPGSVFKTASLMVALDDGVVDTTYTVDTGSGIWDMYGAKMRDHNWHKGGYQVLTLPQVLEYSSNIGVSRIIDKYYGKNPEKFVKALDRIGIREDLKLPIVGYAPPRIRMPKKNKHGQYVNWSKTALPWMSIGYETQVPPISTLTFYNAIANNGTMVRPRFVKQVVKDGKVIKEFPTEIIKQRICKEKTLREIQTILEHVVSQGLGKKAGSESFKVAGKTGTAQISKGVSGYKAGTVSYLLSFVGFFPADNPRYSCIVCIQKSGLPASSGYSALVFHNIAEGIMAQSLKLDVTDARDSLSVLMPDVKNGNLIAADYVLTHLGIHSNKNWSGSYTEGNPIWGTARKNTSDVVLSKGNTYSMKVVPDVRGMGARDAVFALERRGVKVWLNGRGKVTHQSLAPGHVIKKGETCSLKLEL